ncbi:MAG: hypothetical protein AB8B53_08250 [Flavobacteriales bacterium]
MKRKKYWLIFGAFLLTYVVSNLMFIRDVNFFLCSEGQFLRETEITVWINDNEVFQGVVESGINEYSEFNAKLNGFNNNITILNENKAVIFSEHFFLFANENIRLTRFYTDTCDSFIKLRKFNGPLIFE